MNFVIHKALPDERNLFSGEKNKPLKVSCCPLTCTLSVLSAFHFLSRIPADGKQKLVPKMNCVLQKNVTRCKTRGATLLRLKHTLKKEQLFNCLFPSPLFQPYEMWIRFASTCVSIYSLRNKEMTSQFYSLSIIIRVCREKDKWWPLTEAMDCLMHTRVATSSLRVLFKKFHFLSCVNVLQSLSLFYANMAALRAAVGSSRRSCQHMCEMPDALIRGEGNGFHLSASRISFVFISRPD